MTKRAAKGGEIGANGEFYEGGKFINTVAENSKKEGSKPKGNKARKVQVEPYVWVVDDRKPILSIVGTGAAYINRSRWQDGIEPFMPVFNEDGSQKCGCYNLSEVKALCERFNAGERWI